MTCIDLPDDPVLYSLALAPVQAGVGISHDVARDGRVDRGEEAPEGPVQTGGGAAHFDYLDVGGGRVRGDKGGRHVGGDVHAERPAGVVNGQEADILSDASGVLGIVAEDAENHVAT